MQSARTPTPLIDAIKNSTGKINFDEIKNASIEERDNEHGLTPLMWAVLLGNKEALFWLFKLDSQGKPTRDPGLQLKDKSNIPHTALMHAASFEDPDQNNQETKVDDAIQKRRAINYRFLNIVAQQQNSLDQILDDFAQTAPVVAHFNNVHFFKSVLNEVFNLFKVKPDVKKLPEPLILFINRFLRAAIGLNSTALCHYILVCAPWAECIKNHPDNKKIVIEAIQKKAVNVACDLISNNFSVMDEKENKSALTYTLLQGFDNPADKKTLIRKLSEKHPKLVTVQDVKIAFPDKEILRFLASADSGQLWCMNIDDYLPIWNHDYLALVQFWIERAFKLDAYWPTPNGSSFLRSVLSKGIELFVEEKEDAKQKNILQGIKNLLEAGIAVVPYDLYKALPCKDERLFQVLERNFIKIADNQKPHFNWLIVNSIWLNRNEFWKCPKLILEFLSLGYPIINDSTLQYFLENYRQDLLQKKNDMAQCDVLAVIEAAQRQKPLYPTLSHLHVAIESGDERLVSSLIQYGAPVLPGPLSFSKSALEKAVDCGHVHLIKMFLGVNTTWPDKTMQAAIKLCDEKANLIKQKATVFQRIKQILILFSAGLHEKTFDPKQFDSVDRNDQCDLIHLFINKRGYSKDYLFSIFKGDIAQRYEEFLRNVDVVAVTPSAPPLPEQKSMPVMAVPNAPALEGVALPFGSKAAQQEGIPQQALAPAQEIPADVKANGALVSQEGVERIENRGYNPPQPVKAPIIAELPPQNQGRPVTPNGVAAVNHAVAHEEEGDPGEQEEEEEFSTPGIAAVSAVMESKSVPPSRRLSIFSNSPAAVSRDDSLELRTDKEEDDKLLLQWNSVIRADNFWNRRPHLQQLRVTMKQVVDQCWAELHQETLGLSSLRKSR